MNNDFEVHAIGTAKEITLSRSLARAIENELKENSNSISPAVYQEYAALVGHYNWQIENGAP